MNAMFKKGVLASVLAVAASSAMAASSVDIHVTGKIVPSSCTPAFISGGGIADFGTMKVASLNSTTPTPLADVKIIPISITCEEATRVGVTFNDSHVDSAPTENMPVNFIDSDFITSAGFTAGLGMYGDKKIGAYSIFTSDNGASWGVKSGFRYLQVKPDKSEIYSFTDQATGTVAPVAQTKINFNVGIAAMINPTNDLNITDEATLDGLTNVELVYL